MGHISRVPPIYDKICSKNFSIRIVLKAGNNNTGYKNTGNINTGVDFIDFNINRQI